VSFNELAIGDAVLLEDGTTGRVADLIHEREDVYTILFEAGHAKKKLLKYVDLDRIRRKL